jgi:hypothetical protein
MPLKPTRHRRMGSSTVTVSPSSWKLSLVEEAVLLLLQFAAVIETFAVVSTGRRNTLEYVSP